MDEGERDSEMAQAESSRKPEEITQLRAPRQRAVDGSKTLSHSRARAHLNLHSDSRSRSRSLRQAQEDKTAISERREARERGKIALQNRRLRAELDAARCQLECKELELQNSQTKYDELNTLLETRTRELKAAQVYLTKADTLSGAEVIALVDALNVEILQTAAFISDSFDFVRQPAHVDEIKEASTRIIGELMGASLTHLLSTVLHSENPLLVQIALQGAAVELSRIIIMSWNFDDPQAERPLRDIYSDIRETEMQEVGGRWRALTRAHARKAALLSTDLHTTMVAHFSNTLIAILIAAGCTKTYEEIWSVFTHKFGERISNIVKMALRLNKAMGEEVTSADLWPTNATSGEKFDEAVMEDLEAHGEDSQGKAILCTTALGLQRSEKVVQGNVVCFRVTTLLKPKVVLESVADALEQEEV